MNHQTITLEEITTPHAILDDARTTFALSLIATRRAPTPEGWDDAAAQIKDWLNGLRTHLPRTAPMGRDLVGADWRRACDENASPIWRSIEATVHAPDAQPPKYNDRDKQDIQAIDERISWLELWRYDVQAQRDAENDPLRRQGLEALIAEINVRITALRSIGNVVAAMPSGAAAPPSMMTWSVAQHTACVREPHLQKIQSDIAVRLATQQTRRERNGAATSHTASTSQDSIDAMTLERNFLRDAFVTAYIAFAIANRERDDQCARWISEHRLLIKDWLTGRRLDLQQSGRDKSWANATARCAMRTLHGEVDQLAETLTGMMDLSGALPQIFDVRLTVGDAQRIAEAMMRGASPERSTYIAKAIQGELFVRQKAQEIMTTPDYPRSSYSDAVTTTYAYRTSAYFYAMRKSIGLVDETDRHVVTSARRRTR